MKYGIQSCTVNTFEGMLRDRMNAARAQPGKIKNLRLVWKNRLLLYQWKQAYWKYRILCVVENSEGKRQSEGEEE